MYINAKIIVLAGGPASGKSSVLRLLKQRKTVSDINILFLDEVATSFLRNCPPVVRDKYDPFLLQFYILRSQQFAENALIQNADPQKPTVLITDRGSLDAYVYLTEKERRAMDSENFAQFWERYDHVVYLKGCMENYLVDRETQRLETDIEEVRATEEKAFRVWSQCRSFHCIGQQDNIEQKVSLVIQNIHDYLGRDVFME